MKFDHLLQEVRQVVDPVLQSQGVELIDLEYQRESQGWVLRIYIDREGGITVQDCAELSGELGAILEVRDLIDNPYTLEVSSPGLTRPLKKPEDYNRYRNRLAKIKTFELIEGQKNFKGILQGLEGETVYLQVEGRILEIPLRGIAKANLEIEF
ncbi:MAG: ribosome maturation factor RimP [Deltaproteobacteria bacterium]|nr:ribosome maturation factor RimP [Deltaproteobacteria bacterium]